MRSPLISTQRVDVNIVADYKNQRLDIEVTKV